MATNSIRRYYAGIGSRSAPSGVLSRMTHLAAKLEKEGYVLRSGNAEGSDQAFQDGVKDAGNMEIFLSKDGCQPWALEEAKKHLPNDRFGFDSWKDCVKGLMARNMMQVLGRGGDQPAAFVVCYTHSFKYDTSEAGGTGYAIKCALSRDIPVYNLLDVVVLGCLDVYLGQEGLLFDEVMGWCFVYEY